MFYDANSEENCENISVYASSAGSKDITGGGMEEEEVRRNRPSLLPPHGVGYSVVRQVLEFLYLIGRAQLCLRF